MDIPSYVDDNIKNILEDYFKYYRNRNNKKYLTKAITLRCNTLLMLNNDLDKLTMNDDYEKYATEFINSELVPNIETITFEEFFILFTKPNVIKNTLFKGLLRNKPFFDNIESYHGIIIAILHNPRKYRLSLSNKEKENIIISLIKSSDNKSFNKPKIENIIYIAFSFIIIYCTRYSVNFSESIKLYSINHDISIENQSSHDISIENQQSHDISIENKPSHDISIENQHITHIVDGFTASQRKLLYFGMKQNNVGSNNINIVETEKVSILETDKVNRLETEKVSILEIDKVNRLETDKVKSENSLDCNEVLNHISNQVFDDKSESIKSEYDILMEPYVLMVPGENIPMYIFFNYLPKIFPDEIQMLYWSQHILQQEQIHMNKLHVVESIKSYYEWLNKDEFPYIA